MIEKLNLHPYSKENLQILTVSCHCCFSVDADTGQVCADFLDDLNCWKEFYSISYMLLSIQVNKTQIKCSNTMSVHVVQTSKFVLFCVRDSYKIPTGTCSIC